jgi:hypothetical protein
VRRRRYGDPPVHQRCNLQEPGEGIETTDERLLLDFFSEVIRYVGVERVDRKIGIAADLREKAEPQDVFHVDVETRFTSRKGKARAVLPQVAATAVGGRRASSA